MYVSIDTELKKKESSTWKTTTRIIAKTKFKKER